MNQALEGENSETIDRAQVQRPRWPRLAAAAVLIPLVVLVVLEAALRIADVGYSPDLLTPCTVNGTPASCYNLFFGATFFPAGMVQTPRLFSIPATKAPGTYRIFVLGESAAMGDPDSAYAFSRYLEVMLRERYPAMHFEVVNTGSVAIDSHVMLPVAKGLATQKPDLWIIYSGSNEVVGPYGPGTVLTSTGMSMPLIRGSIFFRSTRIGQLATKVGKHKQEWSGMQMFLGKQLPASSRLMKSVYANYEENLRDTIAVARKSGARVMLSTAAVNLRDCAPFASLHREGLTDADLRSWTALVQQGDQLYAANSPGDALKQYQAAAKIDDQYAELEFRLGRAFCASGDCKSAKEHFSQARDLDALHFRADRRINDVNRSVARSMPGVELIDAENFLSDASADGVVGNDLIYEHVHLTPEGNYLLARAMFQQIAKGLSTGNAAANVEPLSQTECERLLALTHFDRARMAAEMFNRMQKPPFTMQMNHSEQLLQMSMKAQLPQDETADDVVAQYRFAIERAPEDKMLRLRFGSFLFPYNRVAAGQQMALAQPWDGYPVFLPDGTRVR